MVQQRALPDTTVNYRTSPDTFGAAVGQGLQNLNESMMRIHADMKEKDDNAIVKQKMSDFRRTVNEMQFTGEGAYYTRKGQDAYQGMPEQMKALDEMRRLNSEGLTPSQQNKFNLIAQQYLDSENGSMSRHAMKERTTWLNQEDEAAIMVAQEDAALRWNDNKMYRDQIVKTVSNLSERNGWGADRSEIELEKHLSQMHMGAIDQMISFSPEAAAEYFKENKGEISALVHDDIQRKIDGQIDAVWSQSEADRIRVGGGTRAERLDMVNQIDDPERRKIVKAQVLHDFEQEKKARREDTEKNYDQALKDIASGDISPTQWAAKNFDEWDAMSFDMQQNLLKGGKRQFNHKAYDRMSGLIAERKLDQADDYLTLNPHLFTDSDYKAFRKDISNGDSATIEAWASRTQRFKSKINELSLNDEDKAQLEVEMERAYRDYQVIFGKKPDANAEDKIIDDLIIKAIDEPWYKVFSSDKRAFEVVGEAFDRRVAEFRDRFGRYPSPEEEARIRHTILSTGSFDDE